MTQAEFHEFTTYYYRSPAPDRAPDALEWFALSPWVNDASARAPAAYFFARIAQDHPTVIPGYEAALEKASPQGKAFIADLLRGLQGEIPAIVNALERPIRTPTDNDLLWAEYSLTGSREPVVRLIDVLDWSDRIREKLDAWVKSKHLDPQTCGRLQDVAGIVCDPERMEIATLDDLDCLCMLERFKPSRTRFDQVQQALPFELSAADVTHIAIKATAKWSLASHVWEDSRVHEICKEEAARRTGCSKRALLEITGAATTPEEGPPSTRLPVTHPQSLTGRAVLALALLIGFYALAFGIIGGLLYVPYAQWQYHVRIPGKLIVFCVAGAALILWSIIPRRDRFVPPGSRLLPQTQPRLFAELRHIASAVGQPMPAEVYLDPQVNAWVAQRGGILGIGGRRVMGLGLPLLQVLTVSQFRAVLAHEFGHYHGGDTKLGPLVYTTRAAIVRTFQALSRHESILQFPFLWYGRMFLRLTHAVSRSQEFAADRLAARALGSQPLIDGLGTIHGAGAAFEPFVRNEVLPLLNAGFRPPVAEGFARFLNAVANATTRVVAAEMVGARQDPYDTHPPLRERIAAVRDLPPGQAPAPDPLAISLVDALPELETGLLVVATGREDVRRLKTIRWDDVATLVSIPSWEAHCREHAGVLRGVTPYFLPELIPKLAELGRKIAGQGASDEEAAAIAIGTLGAALALALGRRGWTVKVAPGTEDTVQKGEDVIAPWEVLGRLARGELSADAWRRRCTDLGIAGLDLGEFAPEDAGSAPSELGLKESATTVRPAEPMPEAGVETLPKPAGAEGAVRAPASGIFGLSRRATVFLAIILVAVLLILYQVLSSRPTPETRKESPTEPATAVGRQDAPKGACPWGTFYKTGVGCTKIGE